MIRDSVLIFVKGENTKLKSVNCEGLLVVMRELLNLLSDIGDFHLIFFVKIEPQLKTNFTVKPVDLQMNFSKRS